MACPNGQYSTSINAGTCVDVNQCAPGTVETSPATQSSPAVCAACAAGSYCAGGQADEVACSASTWDDDRDPATPCVSKTTCVAGQYVMSAGNTTTDRTCTACGAGTFSTTQNASSCVAWSNCAAGTYVQTAGSSTSNRSCANCSSSFSTTQNATSCTAWSTCAAPNYYMMTAGSSTSNHVCATCTPPAQTSTNNAAMCTVLAFRMSGGSVVMEAENYTSTSANTSTDTWTSFANGSISGGVGMELGPVNGSAWTSNPATTAPRLVYNVDFTATGTFHVHIRGNDGPGGGNADSCWGGIDDVQFGSLFDFPEATGTWAWVTQSVVVNTTGVHTFTLWGREDGFQVDKIVISTNAAQPSGNGPSESPRN
jgi:hypothetical protein